MAIDLERLFSTLAQLVGRPVLSDREVGNAFRDTMAAFMTFDHVVVFAYSGSARPIDLYSTFSPSDYHVFVTLYQDGPYLLDPFFRAASLRQSGVFRMQELAPDRFYSSEYFRSYYEKTGLAEELGFFVPVENGATIVLSLMRKARTGSFSNRDLSQLQAAHPFVSALVRHGWNDCAGRFAPDAPKPETATAPSEVATRVWSSLNLTARETAIIEKVLQGFSSESIGLEMGIATGTVKVHRRNIYRKLGISSQTQLLSLYLDKLRQAR